MAANVTPQKRTKSGLDSSTIWSNPFLKDLLDREFQNFQEKFDSILCSWIVEFLIWNYLGESKYNFGLACIFSLFWDFLSGFSRTWSIACGFNWYFVIISWYPSRKLGETICKASCYLDWDSAKFVSSLDEYIIIIIIIIIKYNYDSTYIKMVNIYYTQIDIEVIH